MLQAIKRKNRMLWWIVMSGIGLLFFYKIGKAIQSMQLGFKEDLAPIYSISGADSALINPKYLSDLKVDVVVRTKGRNNFSILTLRKNLNLVIYKIGEINTDLNSAINLEVKSASRSTGVVYHIMSLSSATYQYKVGSVGDVRRIFLTLSGNSIKNIVKNDTVRAYSLSNNSLSISYGVDSAVDIFVESAATILDKPKPLQIMFVKRQGSIYFITLTTSKFETLRDDIILDIIKC